MEVADGLGDGFANKIEIIWSKVSMLVNETWLREAIFREVEEEHVALNEQARAVCVSLHCMHKALTKLRVAEGQVRRHQI